MVSTSDVKDEREIGTKHPSKVYRVDHGTNGRSLGVISQRCARMDDPSMARSYPTNDRMLR